jgi:hypothetical protein
VWVSARAATFAALVETAFDLYRQDLYVQLRWSLPATPHDECKEGRRVWISLRNFSPPSAPEPPIAEDHKERPADESIG